MNEKILYSLNDVTIIPNKLNDISSRSQCHVYYPNGKLPLFAAPMSCVIDENNWKTFDQLGINAIVPRSVDFNKRLELSVSTFVAIGLAELEKIVKEGESLINREMKHYFCVDIANGHMKVLYDLCYKAKEIFGHNISFMVGNIANPVTFYYIAANYPGVIDYVRCGIGGGSACTTSANGGVHYPMASLISDIYDECIRLDKKMNKSYPTEFPKLVADGGFSNFDQIIKALALGADYVMLGKIFAKTEEACGETHIKYEWDNPNALVYVNESEYYGDKEYVKYRKYYGMSTRKAQQEFGGNGTKTAEGIETWVDVEYTLAGWVENFKSYLKSAMSYTNFKDIYDFVGGPQLYLMTGSAYRSYFK